VTWGGLGSDRIIVQGKDSAANGGPGRDRIAAQGTARTMVIGGAGRDVLIGGKAVTLINAQDGAGGDRIICRSSLNRVMLDAGDSTAGPCQVIGTN
jgi:Ca2+-binding RTX toxin-like protein